MFNLGTGVGVSVLEMVKAMEGACGHELKTVMAPRRAGDSTWYTCIHRQRQMNYV